MAGNPNTYTSSTLPITLQQASKSGYTFDGWYENVNFTGNQVSQFAADTTGNKTLWAKWTPVPVESYTITYHLDGGTNAAGNPNTYTSSTLPVTLQQASKSGYTFDGWYENANFTGNQVSQFAAGTTGNKEFWAKWKEKINLAITGDDHVTSINPSSLVIDKGSTWADVKADANGAIGFASHYEFKEWRLNNENGAILEDDYSFNGDGTVYGVSWERPKSITMTLSPDKLTIKIKIRTLDDSDVTVEGCGSTTSLPGNDYDEERTLTAEGGTTIKLTGSISSFDCGGTSDNNQKITAIDVGECTTLISLRCPYNELSFLDVHGLSNLRYLYCFANQLSSLNVQGVSKLKGLNCSGNQLTSLNVEGCPVLYSLECYENSFDSDGFAGIFEDLPPKSEYSVCSLYKDIAEEGNLKFTATNAPQYFSQARERNWTMKYKDASGNWQVME